MYQVDYVWNSRSRAYVDYIVPGSISGCSNFDSLLFSQLLCFYSTSDCFSILMSYIKNNYYYNLEDPIPPWFDPRPLVYNPTTSRYPPNTSVSDIVKQIMIETWNTSYSFKTFYDLCAPKSCFYSEEIRKNTIFSTIIILLSVLGGLTISLRLITPHLVQVICKLLAKVTQKQPEQQPGILSRKSSDFSDFAF